MDAQGKQATVQTPGTNKKRHLAGSIHWRTGQVFVTEAAPKQGRNSALFIKHLDDLRRRLRRYKKIHVICDNAGFHTSHEVIEYLWEHEGRIEVHLLPNYSPDYNPIERVWWHLHEDDHAEPSVSRTWGNYWRRCSPGSERENPFEIEGSVYPKAKAA